MKTRDYRELSLIIIFAALLYLPALGSTGLWDPWETHYAEVARQMLVRGDYLHPFWESSYFFSKPVLFFWMMVPGLALTDAAGPDGVMSQYASWAVRVPVALCAILMVATIYRTAGRLFGRATGLVSAVIAATCPLQLFLARQAMTDIPYLALVTVALCHFMLAAFGEGGRGRDAGGGRARHFYVFYVFAALATLAKGFLGFALPGAVIFAYLILSWEWRLLLRARLITGSLLFFAIAAPWYVVMILFDGRDGEGKTFLTRFIVHDHLKRLSTGVHGDRGTFSYFIEQLGFAAFPWIALLPAALVNLLSRPWRSWEVRGMKTEGMERERRALLFVFLWFLITFVTFALSITKFHHYIFSVLPPLSLLLGRYLVWLWERRVRLTRLAAFITLGVYVLVARDIGLTPKVLIDLFTYKYTRTYPRELDLHIAFAIAFTAVGLGMVILYLLRRPRAALVPLGGLGIVFAMYLSYYHTNAYAPHWTQRRIFETYYRERAGGEPIGAYRMNWRGETFYSRNRVKQLKNDPKLRRFIKRPGRLFLITERGRLKKLKSLITKKQRDSLKILDRSCNKFYLVSVESGTS